MKLLIISLLSLLVFMAALAGASYLLPTHLGVQQSIVVAAPPSEVYKHLDNPVEWEKWTVVNRQTDPSMIYLYGGPMAGAGARMQWSGDKVGTGQVLFTESISPTALHYLESVGHDTSKFQGSFTLAEVKGGTEVVWRQQAVFGEYPWDRVNCLLQTYKKKEEVETGLLGLKSLLSMNSKKKALK